jgi:4a-hydroxytetrahydrobiopterin dehydratase
MGLAQKKGRSSKSAISRKKAEDLHRHVREWVLGEKTLEREFGFDGFAEAVDFVYDVASIAEAADHHPEIHISYKTVRLTLSTHAVGGLTEKDFLLAAQINQLIA